MQKLIYGIGVFLTLLIIIGFILPQTHRVEVTTEIDAHPATVFALVNDFRRVSLWSPSAHTDPNARFHWSESLSTAVARTTRRWVAGTGRAQAASKDGIAKYGGIVVPRRRAGTSDPEK